MRTPRKLLLGPGLLFLVSSMAAREAASQEEYVRSSEVCLECHDREYDSYRRSVHYQVETGDWQVPGCESCHGPGAEHVETDGETPMLFGTSTLFTLEEKIAQCLGCHTGETTFQFRSSDHARGTTECSDCHKPHASARLDHLLEEVRGDVRPAAGIVTRVFEAGHEACLQCHQEIRTSVNLNERHRILEGMVQCSDCHEQHGVSTRSRLGGFNQETCFECHTDKQGPFVFEHPASRIEGCTSCHTPHGSINRHMLTHQSTADLCYSCHVDVPGFHARFNNTTNCVNCHSTIHGSQLSRFFLR